MQIDPSAQVTPLVNGVDNAYFYEIVDFVSGNKFLMDVAGKVALMPEAALPADVIAAANTFLASNVPVPLLQAEQDDADATGQNVKPPTRVAAQQPIT